MPRGGCLAVSTEFRQPEKAVHLRVSDNGIGIPSQVLPHVFEPFFTTKDSQLRTGLGLAVAHSIVEQHGGGIVARSQPGQGTEFVITLPLEMPAETSAPEAVGTADSGGNP